MDKQAIEDLNFLLKDELAAIVAYGQVLDKLDGDNKTAVLKDNLKSHQDRSTKLTKAVVTLGGQPVSDIGLAGKLAKLFMDGASAVNTDIMLTALTEDEASWSSDYEWRLVSMHGDHRDLVKTDLFPEQQKTEEKLREVENSINKGLWPAAPGTKDI